MKALAALLTITLASCSTQYQRGQMAAQYAEAKAIRNPTLANQFNAELLGYITGQPARRSTYNPYLSPTQNQYLARP